MHCKDFTRQPAGSYADLKMSRSPIKCKEQGEGVFWAEWHFLAGGAGDGWFLSWMMDQGLMTQTPS